MAKYLSSSVQDRIVDSIEKVFSLNGEFHLQDMCSKLGIDRAAWYRWKKQQQRLTPKRARNLLETTGLSPSLFLSGVDLDEQAILRPYNKYSYILPMYHKYKAGDKINQKNSLLVETAVALQEILAENEINLELFSRLYQHPPQVVIQRDSPFMRIIFTHGESPHAHVFRNPTEPLASFLLGKEGFVELVRFCLRLDYQDKRIHKREHNAIENMATRLTHKSL